MLCHHEQEEHFHQGMETMCENGKQGKPPSRLDWDTLNSIATSQTHWLPRENKDMQSNIEAFEELAQHELDILFQQ